MIKSFFINYILPNINFRKIIKKKYKLDNLDFVYGEKYKLNIHKNIYVLYDILSIYICNVHTYIIILNNIKSYKGEKLILYLKMNKIFGCYKFKRLKKYITDLIYNKTILTISNSKDIINYDSFKKNYVQLYEYIILLDKGSPNYDKQYCNSFMELVGNNNFKDIENIKWNCNVWKSIVEEETNRENEVKNIKLSGNSSVECRKCGTYVVVRKQQMRAADEPATYFYTCPGCGAKWKR